MQKAFRSSPGDHELGFRARAGDRRGLRCFVSSLNARVKCTFPLRICDHPSSRRRRKRSAGLRAKMQGAGAGGNRWSSRNISNAKLPSTAASRPQEPPQGHHYTHRRYSMDDDRCFPSRGKGPALPSLSSAKPKSNVDYVDWSRAVPASPTKLSRHNPFVSPPRRVSLAVEQKEKILSLTELNNSLAKEVSGLQVDKTSLAGRVNELEDELKAIGDKMCSLEAEKRELGVRMGESRGELAARDSKIQALTQEKRALESEKLMLLDMKNSLEGQLVEIDKKLKESSKRAEEAEAVVAVAVDEIDGLGHRLIRGGDKLLDQQQQQQSFISDIAKKIELNGLQSCKGALRKELKRFSSMVMKAKEEVGEAKALIETLRVDEAKFKEEKTKLERALEAAIERSAQLERQEKALSGNIQALEVRVLDLETELRMAKSEHEQARAEVAEQACTSENELDAIRRSIHVLGENSHKGMQQVLALQQQIAAQAESQGTDKMDLEAARTNLKELMASSMEEMVKAEEQLVKLKQEVEGLEAALVVARDASQESEREIWEAVAKLGKEGDSRLPPIPASATYVLALGLFAYTIYNSSSSD